MKDQTGGLDLYDIRNFTNQEGVDPIDFYFNKQPENIQIQILQALHVNPTYKLPPNIFYSDPGVDDTLARSNDIYGNNTYAFIKYVALRMPVFIMEGAFDSMDGILPLEVYKEYITGKKGCSPRMSLNFSLGDQCYTKGYY